MYLEFTDKQIDAKGQAREIQMQILSHNRTSSLKVKHQPQLGPIQCYSMQDRVSVDRTFRVSHFQTIDMLLK